MTMLALSSNYNGSASIHTTPKPAELALGCQAPRRTICRMRPLSVDKNSTTAIDTSPRRQLPWWSSRLKFVRLFILRLWDYLGKTVGFRHLHYSGSGCEQPAVGPSMTTREQSSHTVTVASAKPTALPHMLFSPPAGIMATGFDVTETALTCTKMLTGNARLCMSKACRVALSLIPCIIPVTVTSYSHNPVSECCGSGFGSFVIPTSRAALSWPKSCPSARPLRLEYPPTL